LNNRYPRIMIAGNAGSAGKTLVSIGLCMVLRQKGYNLGVFKKGPDFIDPAWLSWASGHVANNLDTYLMGSDVVLKSFRTNGLSDGFNIIEGNRGLFDGVDEEGTHSTAELAKLLKTPVILVINVTKMTRTAAAFVLGCKCLDPELEISGVILNNVAGSRHERVLRNVIEKYCSVPVVGAVPKIDDPYLLPDRHLGLVTPEEHLCSDSIRDKLISIIIDNLDVEAIEDIANAAEPLNNELNDFPVKTTPVESEVKITGSVKIAYFHDSAFTFYYPENLRALRDNGAILIPVSALNDSNLPDVDGLYIGGGFPETHSSALADNYGLLESVRNNAQKGLPIYAECGGMIYLANTLFVDHKEYSLSGVLPIDVKMNPKPQGHGYSKLEVDTPNPFFPIGLELKGHEFHYSNIIKTREIETAFSVLRGTGSFDRRDGLIHKNILASYVHIHALATPQWASCFVNTATKYKLSKIKENFIPKDHESEEFI
jgi:cobyrinic acid a,c-diamide synthase